VVDVSNLRLIVVALYLVDMIGTRTQILKVRKLALPASLERDARGEPSWQLSLLVPYLEIELPG
jgi:hypothetical protein